MEEEPIDPDRVEQDNHLAFTKIRDMASGLKAVEDLEYRILSSVENTKPNLQTPEKTS